jgi:hypothetical protein
MLPDVNRWPSADATRLAWQREVDLGIDVNAFVDASPAPTRPSEGDVFALRAARYKAVGHHRAHLLPTCYED